MSPGNYIVTKLCGPWSYLSNNYTGRPEKLAHFLYALTSYAITSSNIHRFSNLFHCLNQNICNNTVTKDSATPQMCRYTTVTTLWNVNVLKARIENKTTSVGTYFKKLTTGNNMFIISVIVKSSCRILQFLHQMFNVSVLLLDDALALTEFVLFQLLL